MILYNNSTSDYNQHPNKFSEASMHVKLLRNLALEIFKTLNHLNPEYMNKNKLSIKLQILQIGHLI